eukprot:m.74911 g.74911  ORF g.74911 m.74911 type:complete len:229 (+) comp11827_c0_seq2:73-759(+)
MLSSKDIKKLSGEYDLGQVRRLVVNARNIHSLGSINQCKTLQHISFRNNKVDSLESLSALTMLESIDATANRITSLSPLQKLENLKQLYISSNPLPSLDQILSPLKQLKSLQRLDFCDPNDEDYEMDHKMIFAVLPRLTVLNGQRKEFLLLANEDDEDEDLHELSQDLELPIKQMDSNLPRLLDNKVQTEVKRRFEEVLSEVDDLMGELEEEIHRKRKEFNYEDMFQG